jgi:hypothetical protein
MRTPGRNNEDGGDEDNDELMDLDVMPGSGDTGNKPIQPPGSAARSVSSRASGGSALSRTAQENAGGGRRKVGIHGDQRSVTSGVAPFSPVSSLGLPSLSPASRSNNSPRVRGGAGDILFLISFSNPI